MEAEKDVSRLSKQFFLKAIRVLQKMKSRTRRERDPLFSIIRGIVKGS